MYTPIPLLIVGLTCMITGCAQPQKPQPLSITASDPPFSQTVGEDLKKFEGLSGFSLNYGLTMLGLIAKNVEVTSGIPTAECPHVLGHVISGATARELLANAVKLHPEYASQRINAVLKQIMPLPKCVEGPTGTRSAIFTSENNDPPMTIQFPNNSSTSQ